eukprot:GHRR01037349.1.p1 GENE.GHRR01037349.1~~GHRR01037349.1.p1  ORF type:complete len:151 (-),score=54.59 GHRR01037349.1:30-482(-)
MRCSLCEAASAAHRQMALNCIMVLCFRRKGAANRSNLTPYLLLVWLQLLLQYAALASKVTMTSEVEHTIAGDTSWANAATEHSQPLLPSSTPTAAQDAVAATAMSAALAAANARIEELLDDKADLEYEIDVVEKKVELLRDEVSQECTAC